MNVAPHMTVLLALRPARFLCFGVFLATLLTAPPHPWARTQVGAKAEQALLAARRGALARRAGDLASSCRAFDRAVKLAPNWAVAQLELARCLRLLGAPRAQAERHLALALRWYPRWSLVHIELGKLSEDHGLRARAHAAYRRAVALEPADVRGQAGLVRSFANRRAPALLRYLKRLLARQPNDIAVWRRLAVVYEARKQLVQAEHALRQVLARSRHPAAAAAALGRFGVRTGRPAAVQTARKLLKAGK